jgi:hypothetical protein
MEAVNTLTTNEHKPGKFSLYNSPISNIIPTKEPITLEELYRCITSIDLESVTNDVRLQQDKTTRNRIKAERLSYMTVSGIFTERKDAALIEHSGLICIDIDHIEELDELRSQIIQYHLPALVFKSPSGNGLKVIYQVDISQGTHLEYFLALENYFKWVHGVEIDKAGKDVSRACFLCYDPEAFITKNPYILSRSFIDTYTPELIDRFEAGKEYLNRRGWSFQDGGRNNYIMQLAAYCHRRGLSLQEVKTKLVKYEEPGFPAREIDQIINSIYKNEAFAGVSYPSPEPRHKTKSVEPVPPFPVEVLPGFIRDLVIECHTVYGTPVDFWAGAILTAISTAIGNSVILNDGKYFNNTSLWFAFVGPTGIGKTEPLSFALNPFHQLDRAAHWEYKEKKQCLDKYRNMTKKERENEDPPERPVLLQYLLTDFTPEALAQVHTDNPRGVIVHRDELMGWINDFNRYNKSGEVQNWLSIWSGITVTYNRRTQDPVKIVHPCVSIAGSVQPELLRAMGADHRTENGLMHRFCFFYPDHADKPYYNRENLPYSAVSDYDQFIRTLLSIPMVEGRYLAMGGGARELYKDFVNRNTDLINREKSDYIRGVYSKLEIIALRLAVIHQVSMATLSDGVFSEVSDQAIDAAIQICEYFRVTGKKVYNHFSTVSGLNIPTVAKFLFNEIGIKNKSEIARFLRVSQQYISRVLQQ